MLLQPHDVATGARLLRDLPGFLRHPISLERAGAILRRRLERREPEFLALARATIYANPASPYRRLLRLAGCDYGDLERLVQQEGLEQAMLSLYRQGVYLTVDELKGRRPALRGSSAVTVDPRRLRNPRAVAHLPLQSGGSRGPRTSIPWDLAFIRGQAVNWRLVLEARRCAQGPHAQWTVPGGRSLANLLEFAAFGATKARWFSQIDPAAPGLHPRYRWSAHLLRWGGRLGRVRLPPPEPVPLDDPLPVVQWLTEVLRAGRTPHLGTTASAAVRVCQTALAAGIDLRGAQFTLGGEPLTAARLATIHGVGAEAASSYGSSEAGRIAYSCLAPAAPGDLHLYHDRLALIQPGPNGADNDLPPQALLISSLHQAAPLILLNVSLGDQAEVSARACGCPLQEYGWTTHLAQVRSFEKLNAGGMTLLDADVVHVLEEVLPARFGGGPIHYQLVEQEAADGRPCLRLLVDPAVGPLDGREVADTFLAAIGGGGGVDRITELQWRQAEFLQVERRTPLVTPAGKVLHLHHPTA